jgi:hypothetical protein
VELNRQEEWQNSKHQFSTSEAFGDFSWKSDESYKQESPKQFKDSLRFVEFSKLEL